VAQRPRRLATPLRRNSHTAEHPAALADTTKGRQTHRPPAPPLTPVARRTNDAADASRRRTALKRLATIAAAAALLMILAGPVLAWFTASASVPARISTGIWGDSLTFAPGCSRAVHWDKHGWPRLARVASLDSAGHLALDFGDLSVPGGVWLDVFRVTSAASAPVRVTFVPTGAIAPLISGTGFTVGGNGGSLAPKQTKSIFVRMCVTRATLPGTYQGTLLVSVAGGSETHSVPMTVDVRGRAPSPTPSPSCTSTPRPTPTGSPTCTPTASPSCTPSTSPSCSPTASPSCTPTSSPSCTPSPEPSPMQPALFTGSAGLSTTLAQPGESAPPQVVARVESDGALALAFAALPQDTPSTFTDVIRLTGLTNDRPRLTFTLAGARDTSCVSAGLWDAKRHRLSRDAMLAGGSTESLAVLFDPGRKATPGERTMTLTVVATLKDGRTQTTTYPVTFSWGRTSPSPATSPTSSPCAPSPSSSPRSYPSATPVAVQRSGAELWAFVWRLPLCAMTRSTPTAAD
jgi:predicted ribosomally synthesized peptide with SipW-like signal peptide